jgi:hypothetical protein
LAVHAELERREEVEAAAQHVGLEAGLALQRDEAGVDGPAPRPLLFHDPDLVVGDVDHAAAHEDQDRDGKQARGRDGDNLEHMTSFRRVMTRSA